MEQKIGQYELMEKIGEGTFGEVYHVYDTQLKRDCAMKILKDEHVNNSEYVSRFIRECQRLASLSHPNICPVYEASRDASRPYYVMKLYDKTLEQMIDDWLTEKEVKSISDDILSGLSHVHRSGYLHLDIKPCNIMIDDGKALIADFSLARQKKRGRTTVSNGFSGTYKYAAPEVVDGQDPDERSDIYSFGVVMHQMLTGKYPAFGVPAHEINKNLDEDVDILFSKSLNPDPDNRYHNAEEMKKDIDSILGRNVVVHYLKQHLRKLAKGLTVGTLITFALAFGIKKEFRDSVVAYFTSEDNNRPVYTVQRVGPTPSTDMDDISYMTSAGEEVTPCQDNQIVSFSIDSGEKNKNPELDELEFYVSETKTRLHLVEFMRDPGNEMIHTLSLMPQQKEIDSNGKKIMLSKTIPAVDVVYRNFEDIEGIGKVLTDADKRVLVVR